MEGLDAYFANSLTLNGSTSNPFLNIFQTDHSEFTDVNKSLMKYYDVIEESIEDASQESEEEEDEDTKNIKKYTKLGFEKLRDSIQTYLTLNEKRDEIRREIDSIYKDRNEVLHGIRKISQGKVVDSVSSITNDIEKMVTEVTINKVEQQQAIENELRKMIKVLNSLRDVYGINKNLKNNHVCPICMNNPIAIYCVPCGHTYCRTCMTRDYCDICRSRITKKNPLYI